MASSNHERVGQPLELLKGGLGPFVERELRAKYAEKWTNIVNETLQQPLAGNAKSGLDWDNYALLKVLWDFWKAAFAFQPSCAGRAESRRDRFPNRS